MFFEEDFHRVKFLRYSFDVIESIDSDDDFDTFETTTESGNSLNDGVLSKRLRTMRPKSQLIESATTEEERKLTSRKELGSIPIGKVPTSA
jgi:hypothetical protein